MTISQCALRATIAFFVATVLITSPSAPASSQPPEPAQHPQAAAPFERLADWEVESSIGYLGCEDASKRKPKLYQVFTMNKSVSSDPSESSVLRPLRAKIVEALNRNGWHKCKSINTQDGIIVDTYSKDAKLLEFTQRYSTGAEDALIITIGISRASER